MAAAADPAGSGGGRKSRPASAGLPAGTTDRAPRGLGGGGDGAAPALGGEGAGRAEPGGAEPGSCPAVATARQRRALSARGRG